MKTGSQLVWRPDPLVTRCCRGSRTQQSGSSGLRLSSPGERERQNADGHKSWGQYVAVLFGLQLLLTVKPWVTLFKPFQIKWEVYFSKDCVACHHCVVVFCMNLHMNIQHIHNSFLVVKKEKFLSRKSLYKRVFFYF